MYNIFNSVLNIILVQPEKGESDDGDIVEQTVQRDLTRRKSFLPVDFETRKALLQHHQHKVLTRASCKYYDIADHSKCGCIMILSS